LRDDHHLIIVNDRRRSSRRTSLLVALALAIIGAVGGCDFARVALYNSRWFFRTPSPAPFADRPRADDAALSVLWVGHALRPDQLPHISAVLVSHRHFDHLSKDSLSLLAGRADVILTPAGARADVPREAGPVEELAWDEELHTADGLTITAVRVAHEGNRLLHDGGSHPRAFTGYVIEHRGLTVFFPGDTAYARDRFDAVRRRFPRIDLALLPVGPITPTRMMRAHHLDPAEALTAFEDLGAAQMVPVHFGTFMHSFDLPGEVERALDEALAARPALTARVHRLGPGQRRVIIPLSRGRT
jgi:L-ascorbate metabolism protein UlaG (beta-lactamase superfamily)